MGVSSPSSCSSCSQGRSRCSASMSSASTMTSAQVPNGTHSVDLRSGGHCVSRDPSVNIESLGGRKRRKRQLRRRQKKNSSRLERKVPSIESVEHCSGLLFCFVTNILTLISEYRHQVLGKIRHRMWPYLLVHVRSRCVGARTSSWFCFCVHCV